MLHKSSSLSNLRMRWHDVFHLTEQGSIFLPNEPCSRMRKSSYHLCCRWKYSTKFAEENVYNKKLLKFSSNPEIIADELIKITQKLFHANQECHFQARFHRGDSAFGQSSSIRSVCAAVAIRYACTHLLYLLLDD